MSKITLTEQNFVIEKEQDEMSKQAEFIKINISNDPLCHELKLEIIDGENKITLWEEDARALKQVFERANKVFNQ